MDKFDSKKRFRTNEHIRADEVRLVGEDDGPRVIPIADALAMAKESGLDLVEISPNQDPPVVKLIDYSKFRFDQIKKAKEAKKKQKIVHVKEIKFRPAIDSHDYMHKINHAKEFLDNGDKVKFTIMFRGREIVHKDLGFKIMDNVKADLEGIVLIEKHASVEGRNITMVVAPTVAATPKPKKQHDNEKE
ncbi:MAG TPA: translation initiation factor IF-3 [Spirochaetota bacterium]|nr:translation initiation factor IF-3 [Spirochaetota bacterium]HQO03202.1 translation initiation factor IF-3 [Spirochaetota bacterium]HQP48235.1 translation initiation factor IF-3 [Spirochaetota bacterium]